MPKTNKSGEPRTSDPERNGLAVHGFRQQLVSYYEKLPGRGK